MFLIGLNWAGLLVFGLAAIPAVSADTIRCTADPTIQSLEDLVSCLERFTVPAEYYTLDNKKHCQSQPTAEQRLAWNDALYTLLATNVNCTGPVDPATGGSPLKSIDVPGLQDIYTFSIFTEPATAPGATSPSFCVLSEKYTEADSNGRVAARGWGFAIVPARHDFYHRGFHLSVPRPLQDAGVVQQAATIFKRGQGKSLLVAGRHPRAFPYNTLCGWDATRRTACSWNYRTDGVADDKEPFFDAQKAIRNWQRSPGPEQDRCARNHCEFVQLQLKGPNECVGTTVYVTSGEGVTTTQSDAYYANVNLPARRLRDAINVFTPAKVTGNAGPTCGGINIFERLVNGISAAELCTRGADYGTMTGDAILVKFDQRLVDPVWYSSWTKAFTTAFLPWIHLRRPGQGSVIGEGLVGQLGEQLVLEEEESRLVDEL